MPLEVVSGWLFHDAPVGLKPTSFRISQDHLSLIESYTYLAIHTFRRKLTSSTTSPSKSCEYVL